MKIRTNTALPTFTTIDDSVKIPHQTNGSLEKMEDMAAENHVVFVEENYSLAFSTCHQRKIYEIGNMLFYIKEN